MALHVKTEYTSGVDITAGKFYPVMSSCERSQTHNIIDDAGYPIWVRTNKPSAHLEDIGSFVLYENVKMYWSKNEREN